MTLPFHRNGKRGGYRPGAGRKPLPAGKRAGVPHRTRARLAARYPVHVTVRLRRGLPSLRFSATYALLQECFAAACDRFGFRLTHYSVQSNHIHLICEAKDREALSRGMQGLMIRVAKALNRMWKRRGPVFDGRYHEEILKTPRQVRHALAYVLNNLWRHLRKAVPGRERASGYEIHGVDRYASGAWFDGWRHAPRRARLRGLLGAGPPPVAAPRTWLLQTGWRRHGLVRVDEVPRGSVR